MWGLMLQQKRVEPGNELMLFLEKKMARLGKGVIIGFPFVFEDATRTFRIEFMNLIGDENDDLKVSVRIYYTVIRHGNDDFIIMKESCDGAAGVAAAIRRIINEWVMCHNCLHIMDPSMPCERCLPYRIQTRCEAACAICLEDACYFRLSCDHSFHRLCLIRINPYDSFTSFVFGLIKDRLRCPVCRKPIDCPDLCRIYDIQPDILLN